MNKIKSFTHIGICRAWNIYILALKAESQMNNTEMSCVKYLIWKHFAPNKRAGNGVNSYEIFNDSALSLKYFWKLRFNKPLFSLIGMLNRIKYKVQWKKQMNEPNFSANSDKILENWMNDKPGKWQFWFRLFVLWKKKYFFLSIYNDHANAGTCYNYHVICNS